MKTPTRLEPLVDSQIIDEVMSQLQSGKEAEVYIVRSGVHYCCAKVYKSAEGRSFKQKTQYTEGRQVRGSRQARAMSKKSRYGRQEEEAEWQNTEVEALYSLSAAGVLVPKPFGFYDGVLLLEMITDKDGNVAPRLDNITLTAEEARQYHHLLVRQVVLMLCSGLIHGDLSQFNILMSKSGPVIIDLPQAVQATANNAFRILERDVNQLRDYFSRFAPEISKTQFAKEIWKHYSTGKLKPDTQLTGQFVDTSKRADIRSVLSEIEDARAEEMAKREYKSRK